MASQVAAARRRVIRRPRLTSMLDVSSARIRLLVAPAGYGKTTLAREWLAGPQRHDVWYRGEAASADVAALAAGIAEAAGAIVVNAGKRMRDRIAATGNAQDDVEILAELFAEDVQEWPRDAWLAFDDYQFAAHSAASEHFVDELTKSTPIQMLITSRRRPTWATARRILYGEIQEIDRRALAMEDGEAKAVLGRESRSIEELLVRARGWPAVIGLAALTADFDLPSEALPATLHTYFAEEIFQAADPRTRQELGALAIVPSISHQLISALLGDDRADEVIEIGVRLGILSDRGDDIFVFHPFLRDFLLQHRLGEQCHSASPTRIGDYLLNHGQWDHAFEVACRSSLIPLAERTIENGLDPMLSQGRLATIQRWVDFAVSSHLKSPVVDLAEAELAFREGEQEKAYALAAQAANLFRDRPDLGARAHVRAGHSALLASRERAGLEHFRSAHRLARTPELRREALIGLYFAASELDEPDAGDALEQLESAGDDTPEGVLRLEALRLTRATRVGGIRDALHSALPKLHIADRATDPLGLTAFLHMLATSQNLAAHYEEALDLAERQLITAREHRLELPIVHANLNRAISHFGLRGFQRSARTLDEVRRLLPPSGDTYLEATIRLIDCRRLIATQKFSEAADLTADQGEYISSPPLRAEYLGLRALALGCIGELHRARALINHAQGIFPSSIEVRVLAPCIEAIIGCQQTGAIPEPSATKAWSAAHETGNFDSLVCSYRAEPKLLGGLHCVDPDSPELADLLSRSHDERLAYGVGVQTTKRELRRIEPLTARETEVLRELEEGYTNRKIAQCLFISEATVKAHLRHIYVKFGVRTRTELLARLAKRP
jgi:LuxR family transcriptional regulator, maltose regulon positive regulatory protein